MSTKSFCLLLLGSFLSITVAQSNGWRMIDRFYGFRYEIFGSKILEIGFEAAMQQKADELGCFGWIQRSSMNTLVGEVRCGKSNGPLFQEWIKSGYPTASIDHIDIKVYEDTKIRLHFAYFKIIDDMRDTCFLDPPHKCPDIESSGQETGVTDEL